MKRIMWPHLAGRLRQAGAAGLVAAGLLMGCSSTDTELEPLESIQRIPPVLRGVSPTIAAAGDTVILEGALLDGSGRLGFLNNTYLLVVLDANYSRVRAVLSENIPAGEYRLAYFANGRFSAETLPFTVRRGISDIAPDDAVVRREVVLTGTFEPGADSSRLELTPAAGGTPIVVPFEAVTPSQAVWVVPASLPLGRYRVQVVDLRDNTVLQAREVFEHRSFNPVTDTALVGGLNPTPTPNRYTVTIANARDLIEVYSVLLVRQAEDARSLVGVAASDLELTFNGSNGELAFTAPTTLIPGTYGVRIAYQLGNNRPIVFWTEETIEVN